MATQGYGEAREAGGERWVAFAGAMLGLAGTWNLLEGILAVSGSDVYGNDPAFAFGDLETWGWIVILLGAVELVAAFWVVTRSELGRWVAVGAALLNGLGQLFFLPASAWWALMMFSVDLLVVYALVAHAGERPRRV
jgi:hypothetical protein